jgi:hypothetical protein
MPARSTEEPKSKPSLMRQLIDLEELPLEVKVLKDRALQGRRDLKQLKD